MAKADKLFLVLAIVTIGVAAGAFGLVYGSNDGDDFENAPIDLTAIDEDTGSGIHRNANPSRRTTNNAQEENTKTEPRIADIVAEEGTIVGTVLDHEGEPLADVKVKSTLFFPYGQLNYGLVTRHLGEATTNEEGRFSITVPGHGLYRLSFRHLAFAPHLEDEVKAGADLKIQLKVGGAVTGTLTAKESSKPIAGVKVSVRQYKGRWSESGISDKEGKFIIYGLFVGDLYLSAIADDFLPIKDHEIKIEQGKIAKVELTMSAGRTIKGVVTDKTGTWIAQATVKVGNRTIKGDDFGRFRMGGLEKKSQNLQVHAEGFLTHSRMVGLAGSREVADLKIELDRGGSLNVTVLDEKGTALKNVNVKVFESWGKENMWDTGNTRFAATTNENGQATISGLRRQNWSQYRIRAVAKGWADTFSKQFKMKKGEKEKDFTLIMRAGGTIKGMINNESGQGIPRVKVTLSPSGLYEWTPSGRNSQKSVLTDDKGEYAFDQLSARKYRVSAMARGFATQYKNRLEVVGSATMEGVDFILKDGGIVEGTVKEEDDTPIANARITIRSKRSYGHGKTDKDGNYKITNLGEGPYTATARCDGFSADTKKKIFPVENRIDFELRPDGYVWGVVTDKTDDKPVRSYRVELQQEQPRSRNKWRTKRSIWVNDKAGKFKIFAPDGTYRLIIKSKGHTNYKKDAVAISVTAEPDELAIKLIPGGSVEGWVKNSIGEGIAWTAIYVRKADAPEGTKYVRKGNTETDGYYFVDSLETGNYEFAFEQRGRLPLTIKSPVGVFGGELSNLNVTASKPAIILISAKTEDEKPVRWTQVKIISLSGAPMEMRRRGWTSNGANYEPRFEKSAYINRDRVQRVSGLPPGFYRITAKYSGYKTYDEEFRVKDGAELDIEIVFKKKSKTRASSR